MKNQIHDIFPTLLNNLAEGVVYQDISGKIIYANPAASVILGLSNDQLLGITSYDPSWHTIKEDFSDFPGEEHPAMVALRTGKKQTGIIMGVYRNDANISWIKINAHPIPEGSHPAEFVLASFVDITDQIAAKEQFRKNQQNQKDILNSIHEGFLLIGREYEIDLINNAARDFHLKILGHEVQETDNILNLYKNGKLVGLPEKIEMAFSGDKHEIEKEIVFDKQSCWYQITFTPVKKDNDNILKVCIGINDITIRKTTELKLMGSEKRFRDVLKGLGDNVWEHDFVTKETYFSEQLKDLKAYDPSKKNLETIWWDSLYKDDVWILEQNDKRYKSGEIDSHNKEYRIVLKDGSLRWVLDRGVVIAKDKNGTPLKIIGTHTDITQRKQIEEEIKSNEAKFRTIFNSTFQFMGLMTVEGILLEANQTALDFFRLPKEEVMGMNFIDSRWFSEKTREKSINALAKAARGESVSYELELDLLDGRHVIIDFSIRPILDTDGKVVLLVPEGRDITDKLKMEKALELERLNAQKEILLANIEGQEKHRQEIARELHDNINQVLATIKIYLQLTTENESMRETLLSKCYKNVSHAIEEVRKLSKSLAPPTLDDISLEEALRQMIDDMSLSKIFEVLLSVDLFDESLLNSFQKITIYRIVQEQLTNIIKYAGASKVLMKLKTTQGSCLLSISDDGVGFNITQRNTGIGFKNMKSRVESLNGQLIIESAPNEGCNLTVLLPITKTLPNE